MNRENTKQTKKRETKEIGFGFWILDFGDTLSILSRTHHPVLKTQNLFPLFRAFSFVSCFLWIFFQTSSSSAQERPILKIPRRDFYAGKFLLLPADARPSSFQLPRMIAEVADHELITPSVSALNDLPLLVEWAETVDYADLDGGIISLSLFAKNATALDDAKKLIQSIRANRPAIPIWGIARADELSNQFLQTAGDLLSDRSLDFLLVTFDDVPREELKERIRIEMVKRRVINRVGFDEDSDSATLLLLTRMLSRRFGLFPKILPVYSSSAGRDLVLDGSRLPVHQLINKWIRAIGGIELQQTNEAARGVDLLLFVHTPQTRGRERTALAEAIAGTKDKNVRVALLDLSETKDSKDSMIADLRRRNLGTYLDGFASFDRANEGPDEAISRVLGHAFSYLVAVKFMRDNAERIGRSDRAHYSLILASLLRDWAFAFQVRPKIQARGTGASPDEALALGQLKPVAEELFKEQFRLSQHIVLMSTGETTLSEIRILQRLSVRLFAHPRKPKIIEAEIKPSLHLAYSIERAAKSESYWQFNSSGIDERVVRRWDSTYWAAFKSDPKEVDLAVKISNQPELGEEGYRIRSRRSGDRRRIEINTHSPRGAYYALGKLEQMGAAGQLAKDFQLTEKPSLAERGVFENLNSSPLSYRDRLDLLRYLGRLRMNRYYFVPRSPSGIARENVEGETGKLTELLQVAEENFVQLVYVIKVQSSQDFASITSKLDNLASIGVRRFAVTFGNTSNSEAAKQAELVNRLKEHLKAVGGVELSMAPKPQALNEPGRLCLGPKSYQASGIVESMSNLSQVWLPSLATAADFAWDTQRYDPARAFSDALNLLYDERTLAALLFWSRNVGNCRDGEQPSDQLNNELMRALEAISGTPERGLLRGELGQFILREQNANQNNGVSK
jgi:Protein of unknown function (DUF4127)/beta-N-acetylglucosaminidase